MNPSIPDPAWSDRRLAAACLAGDELAWNALVDKYSQMVFAIVRRYGASREEAADLFQAIWLDAYNDLPQLRRKRALKPWLVSVASHKCYHWKRKHLRQQAHEVGTLDDQEGGRQAAEDPGLLDQLMRDQLVREGLFALSPRCREMIRLLFFTIPPKPYKEVAERLGLAIGSIGFIRGRCLEQLRKALGRHGLQ
ncbi:MAG: RNA polymerase sigma factor [bacterium]|nr:RNA polymerase sigma factor [bacterium]